MDETGRLVQKTMVVCFTTLGTLVIAAAMVGILCLWFLSGITEPAPFLKHLGVISHPSSLLPTSALPQ
jgi:hypothetical protein